MKKLSICLLLAFMLIMTSCTFNVEDMLDVDKTSENASDTETKDGNEAEYTLSKVNLVPMNNNVTTPSTDAETITDEECETMVKDIIEEVCTIAIEFYGVPNYLTLQPGAYEAGETPYTEVYVNPNPYESSVVFENDADYLRELLRKYFSKALIADKFSLEYPCPIYEDKETGKLYRTEYDNTMSGKAADVSAGRILSRENGIVKYGFPLYSINYETRDPKTESWLLGYIDFIYEDGNWKVDSFYVSPLYSPYHLPGPVRMDDFFEIETELVSDGVTAKLNNGRNVEINVNGKEITAELDFNAGRISKIEHVGENIFVSFRGALEEDETFVISESGELKERFVSNGYTATEEGDWFYVVFNRETYKGDIMDKDNEPLLNFAVPQESVATQPEIAPIEKIELGEDGFTITYDTTAY